MTRPVAVLRRERQQPAVGGHRWVGILAVPAVGEPDRRPTSVDARPGRATRPPRCRRRCASRSPSGPVGGDRRVAEVALVELPHAHRPRGSDEKPRRPGFCHGVARDDQLPVRRPRPGASVGSSPSVCWSNRGRSLSPSAAITRKVCSPLIVLGDPGVHDGPPVSRDHRSAVGRPVPRSAGLLAGPQVQQARRPSSIADAGPDDDLVVQRCRRWQRRERVGRGRGRRRGGRRGCRPTGEEDARGRAEVVGGPATVRRCSRSAISSPTPTPSTTAASTTASTRTRPPGGRAAALSGVGEAGPGLRRRRLVLRPRGRASVVAGRRLDGGLGRVGGGACRGSGGPGDGRGWLRG